MSNSTSTSDLEAQIPVKLSWLGSFKNGCEALMRKARRSWPSSTAISPKASRRWIEDYPKGYPQFANLIGSDVGFSLSRRFSVARARLLLKKQDKVSQLEQQLEDLDKREARPLFLGSMRRDQNLDRQTVVQELDAALADYGAYLLQGANTELKLVHKIDTSTDELLERNARILNLPNPTKRYTTSLSNWIVNKGSICRKESAFLDEVDLCTLGRSGDDGLSTLEQYVERLFPPRPTVSRDPRVFIFGGSGQVVTRLLFAWINVALLLVPVIIIRAIQNHVVQVFCTLVASGLFILVLSTVVNARIAEIFIASPTYAALLAVFIITRR